MFAGALSVEKHDDLGVDNETVPTDAWHISFKKTESGGLRGSSDGENRTQEAPARVEGYAFI